MPMSRGRKWLIGIGILIGFLFVGVVTPNLLYNLDANPEYLKTKARQDLRSFQTAINLFRDDVGRLPLQSEGLSVLVASEATANIGGYKPGGYLIGFRGTDPWGNPYRYCTRNNVNMEPVAVICTYGADNKRGGDGVAEDFCDSSNHYGAATADELRRAGCDRNP